MLKNILISGASIAGLSTAWWMNKMGYKVTVVETASEPRTTGAAVDFREDAIEAVKRMGFFEKLKSYSLCVEKIEFKNADDVTEGSILVNHHDAETADEIEIERDKFMHIVYDGLKNDVEFVFSNSITAMQESDSDIKVTFKDGSQRVFHLVFGCDGMHSAVRGIWFGNESEYSHFMGAYFSISILNKLLIKQNTMQMYNVPGKAVTLNAYNSKTDIIFCFNSKEEIEYDYRKNDQQKNIILKQFTGQGWRIPELLEEILRSANFYFDKFCQIKMTSWTKGRVALIGDAGYCASPAAGMGGSLAIAGAAAMADALQKQDVDYKQAFEDYNKNLRPFIQKVQAAAQTNISEKFFPETEEEIHRRNTLAMLF